MCAEPAVGDEPFAVILADDLIDATQPAPMRRSTWKPACGTATRRSPRTPRAIRARVAAIATPL